MRDGVSTAEMGIDPGAAAAAPKKPYRRINRGTPTEKAIQDRWNNRRAERANPNQEREITKETLTQELQKTAHRSIFLEGEKIQDRAGPDGTAAIYPLPPDEALIHGAYGILASEYNPEKPNKNWIDETPDGKPIDPLKFREGNKTLQVVSMIQKENGDFDCIISDTDPSNRALREPRLYTKAQLVDLMLTDPRNVNAILNKLPQEKRESLNLHVEISEKIRKGEDPLEGKDPKKISELITKTAKENGMITNEELRAREGIVPESKRQEFLNLLDGHNLPTEDTLNSFAQLTDLNGWGKDAQIKLGILEDKRATQIEEARRNGRMYIEDENLRVEIDTQREYLKRIEEAQELLKSGGLKPIFERVANGQLDSQTSNAVRSALLSESTDAAVDALFPGLMEKGGTPQEVALREKKLREAKKRAETMGWLALAALLLAGMAVGELGKNVGGGR